MFETEIVVPHPASRGNDQLGVLAYLRALTLNFNREGQDVSAVMIYAEPDPDSASDLRVVVAEDTGFEGIACLDDTARAALLALGLHERSGSPTALRSAREWLTFVTYMQYPDGSFANFIRNAAGVRNASGQTSVKGGYWWSSRALWALARAFRLTGEKAYLESYAACRLDPMPDGKINAILALAELELFQARPEPALRASILEHCDIILAGREDSYFRDTRESEVVSLWGYHQLHAVATAARILEEPRLVTPCRQTVSALIEPNVRDRIWYSYPSKQKDGVCAYCVAPLVQGLAEMYRLTGAKRYRDLGLSAAAWFYGRNDARTAMYDPTTGQCKDGISGGRASLNCGAESAIEAALAEQERRYLLSTE